MFISRLVPLLMIIGAIALFFGYTNPTYNGAIANLQSEIESLDQALEAAEAFKEREAELARQVASLPQEDLTRLQTFLPDSVDNVQLIVDLNELANRSGVELSDFEITGGAEGAEAGGDALTEEEIAAAYDTGEVTGSLQLSTSATGSYAAFRTFLEGIETSLRPLDVVELGVQDSETGVYTYTMTLSLYWLQ